MNGMNPRPYMMIFRLSLKLLVAIEDHVRFSMVPYGVYTVGSLTWSYMAMNGPHRVMLIPTPPIKRTAIRPDMFLCGTRATKGLYWPCKAICGWYGFIWCETTSTPICSYMTIYGLIYI